MIFGAGRKSDSTDAHPVPDPGRAPTGAASAPAVALTVIASDIGAYIGRKVVLEGDELTIGRDTGGYHLPDPQWSRRHATIRRTPEGHDISDLGSTNGTYVNGSAWPLARPTRFSWAHRFASARRPSR